MFCDPGAGAQLLDLRPFESARMPVVDVLQAGGELQLRPVQARGQGSVFPPQPLPFDQQGQAPDSKSLIKVFRVFSQTFPDLDTLGQTRL